MSYIPPPLRSKNVKKTPTTVSNAKKSEKSLIYSPPKKPMIYRPSDSQSTSFTVYDYNARGRGRGRGQARGRGRGLTRGGRITHDSGRGRGLFAMTSDEGHGQQYVIENYRSNYALTHGAIAKAPEAISPVMSSTSAYSRGGGRPSRMRGRGRAEAARGRSGFYNNNANVNVGRSMLNNNWRDKRAPVSKPKIVTEAIDERYMKIIENGFTDEQMQHLQSITVDIADTERKNEFKTISYHPYSGDFQQKYQRRQANRINTKVNVVDEYMQIIREPLKNERSEQRHVPQYMVGELPEMPQALHMHQMTDERMYAQTMHNQLQYHPERDVLQYTHPGTSHARQGITHQNEHEFAKKNDAYSIAYPPHYIYTDNHSHEDANAKQIPDLSQMQLNEYSPMPLNVRNVRNVDNLPQSLMQPGSCPLPHSFYDSKDPLPKPKNEQLPYESIESGRGYSDVHIPKNTRYTHRQKDSILVTGNDAVDRYNRKYSPNVNNDVSTYSMDVMTTNVKSKLSNDFKSLNIESNRNQRRRRRRKKGNEEPKIESQNYRKLNKNIKNENKNVLMEDKSMNKALVNGNIENAYEKRNKMRKMNEKHQNHVQLRVINTKQPPPINWAAAATNKTFKSEEMYHAMDNGYKYENMQKLNHVMEVLLVKDGSGNNAILTIEDVQKLTAIFRRLSIEYKTVIQIQERSFVCFKNEIESFSAYSQMRSIYENGFQMRRINDRPYDVQLLIKHGIPPASPIQRNVRSVDIRKNMSDVSSFGLYAKSNSKEYERKNKQGSYYSAKREWKPK